MMSSCSAHSFAVMPWLQVIYAPFRNSVSAASATSLANYLSKSPSPIERRDSFEHKYHLHDSTIFSRHSVHPHVRSAGDSVQEEVAKILATVGIYNSHITITETPFGEQSSIVALAAEGQLTADGETVLEILAIRLIGLYGNVSVIVRCADVEAKVLFSYTYWPPTEKMLNKNLNAPVGIFDRFGIARAWIRGKFYEAVFPPFLYL